MDPKSSSIQLIRTIPNIENLSLPQIVAIIRRDWKKVNYAAVPYLSAMGTLNTLHDKFYNDEGREIVLYFLSNATTWKGDIARIVKKELNRRLKLTEPRKHTQNLF